MGEDVSVSPAILYHHRLVRGVTHRPLVATTGISMVGSLRPLKPEAYEPYLWFELSSSQRSDEEQILSSLSVNVWFL